MGVKTEKNLKVVFQNVHNVNLSNASSDSKLHYNIMRENLIKCYFNDVDKMNHETPLHIACKYGHYDCVRFLIYNCFDVKNNNCNNQENRIVNLDVKNKNGWLAKDIISKSGKNLTEFELNKLKTLFETQFILEIDPEKQEEGGKERIEEK